MVWIPVPVSTIRVDTGRKSGSIRIRDPTPSTMSDGGHYRGRRQAFLADPVRSALTACVVASGRGSVLTSMAAAYGPVTLSLLGPPSWLPQTTSHVSTARSPGLTKCSGTDIPSYRRPCTFVCRVTAPDAPLAISQGRTVGNVCRSAR
jgi:hypothetical protein